MISVCNVIEWFKIMHTFVCRLLHDFVLFICLMLLQNASSLFGLYRFSLKIVWQKYVVWVLWKEYKQSTLVYSNSYSNGRILCSLKSWSIGILVQNAKPKPTMENMWSLLLHFHFKKTKFCSYKKWFSLETIEKIVSEWCRTSFE